MRELKFRVWNKVTKKMFTPQAISFDIQTSVPFAVSVPRSSWEPVSKYELLQWTGFCDQHRVDVYEGDFVEISSTIYKVVWNQKHAAFELVELKGANTLDIAAVTSGKVIGNEYQGL